MEWKCCISSSIETEWEYFTPSEDLLARQLILRLTEIPFNEKIQPLTKACKTNANYLARISRWAITTTTTTTQSSKSISTTTKAMTMTMMNNYCLKHHNILSSGHQRKLLSFVLSRLKAIWWKSEWPSCLLLSLSLLLSNIVHMLARCKFPLFACLFVVNFGEVYLANKCVSSVKKRKRKRAPRN